MSFRPLVIVAVFAAGMAFAIWAPGVMTSLRPNAGAKTETDRTDSKPKVASDGKAVAPSSLTALIFGFEVFR